MARIRSDRKAKNTSSATTTKPTPVAPPGDNLLNTILKQVVADPANVPAREFLRETLPEVILTFSYSVTDGGDHFTGRELRRVRCDAVELDEGPPRLLAYDLDRQADREFRLDMIEHLAFCDDDQIHSVYFAAGAPGDPTDELQEPVAVGISRISAELIRDTGNRFLLCTGEHCREKPRHLCVMGVIGETSKEEAAHA